MRILYVSAASLRLCRCALVCFVGTCTYKCQRRRLRVPLRHLDAPFSLNSGAVKDQLIKRLSRMQSQAVAGTLFVVPLMQRAKNGQNTSIPARARTFHAYAD